MTVKPYSSIGAVPRERPSVPLIGGRGWRWRWARLFPSVLKPLWYRERVLDVYVLGTGRCGTHFVHGVVKGHVGRGAVHDRGFDVEEPNAFLDNGGPLGRRMTLDDLAGLRAKLIRNQFDRMQIFVECPNGIYPFAPKILDFYVRIGRPTGVRFIHLVREVEEPGAVARLLRFRGVAESDTDLPSLRNEVAGVGRFSPLARPVGTRDTTPEELESIRAVTAQEARAYGD